MWENLKTKKTSLLTEQVKVQNHITTLGRKNLEIDDLKVLVNAQNRDLTLLYTFAKTGIKAETIEEVRELLKLASNLPVGSPFAEDFIVTSPFGRRDESAWQGDGQHIGLDLIPISGKATPIIYLTADGEIVEFGISNVYGKYIVVETTSGYKMVYGHLSKIFYQNDKGEVTGIKLKKGTKLGLMGETGMAIGAHLHFELWILDTEKNEYLLLNPEEVLLYIKS